MRKPREAAAGGGQLAEKRHEHRLAALGVLVERDAHHLAVAQARSTARAAACLRIISTPGPFTHKGHQGVAGQKALGMMNQADLMAVHRVGRSQQFKIAEMRAEHQDAASG